MIVKQSNMMHARKSRKSPITSDSYFSLFVFLRIYFYTVNFDLTYRLTSLTQQLPQMRLSPLPILSLTWTRLMSKDSTLQRNLTTDFLIPNQSCRCHQWPPVCCWSSKCGSIPPPMVRVLVGRWRISALLWDLQVSVPNHPPSSSHPPPAMITLEPSFAHICIYVCTSRPTFSTCLQFWVASWILPTFTFTACWIVSRSVKLNDILVKDWKEVDSILSPDMF